MVPDSSRISPRAGCQNCLDIVQGLPPLGTADTSQATDYSAWPSLLPRYWMPVFESNTDDGASFGASTSGYDVVGRHSYTMEVLRTNRFNENSAWLWYRYSGFGLPLIDLYASQNFSNGRVFNAVGGQTIDVGNILERDRIASLQATFISTWPR